MALDPVLGSEISKTRPCAVISNNLGNEHSARVIVAPLTSYREGMVYPFEVLVPAGEAGVPQASKILLDQIRSVDKQRLGRLIGALPPDRITEVDRAIRISLAV